MEVFKNIPRPIWIFTALWFVFGCLQAAVMDLHPDETYYWQMSRFLDWGYFHQPPMIALFIKVGYALFQSEFGVRLLTVLASTVGVLLLYSLSDTKDHRTFLLVFSGLILTHAGVFMAVPDSPLIFFTLIFLVLLRSYLKRDSIGLALAMGFVAAALMYSKYHAIVLFGSVLVAMPRLLLRRTFWLTAIVATILFLPHVLWQIQHDMVSFKFHWVVREKKVWDIMVLLDYLAGQLIMLGPVGMILAVAMFKLKDRSEFDRILTAIVIGFFGFFFVMALRGKVEANWTASAFLPLIIFGSRSIPNDKKLMGALKPAAYFCGAILIAARIYVASPWAGEGIKLNFPIKGWKQWAVAIKTKADGRPVFFSGTYQYASQYSFYSGEQGYHISPLNYNGNQFDLWSIDQQVEGRPIILILGNGHDAETSVESPGFKTFYAFPLSNYHSYRNLRFEFASNEFESKAGSDLTLKGEVVNRTNEKVDLDSLLRTRPVHMFFYLNGDQTPAQQVDCDGCEGELLPGHSKPVSFSVKIPEVEGKYFIRFGLDFALGMPEQNSDFVKLNVVKQ